MATNTHFVDTLGGTSNLLVETMSDIIAGLVSTVASISATATAWQTRSEQRAQLNSLDSRLLEDMGITRDQVSAEAHKPFWVA